MTAYNKVHENWEDLPSTATPIDADALDQMEAGIASAQDDADAAAGTASAAASAIDDHEALATNAHAASAISVTPTGTITSDDVQAALEELDVAITAGAGYFPGGPDVPIADGGTGASTAGNARTNLGLGSIATQNADNVSISGGTLSGITDIAVADGGTGASTAAGARTNLEVVKITVSASQPGSPATNDLWVDIS